MRVDSRVRHEARPAWWRVGWRAALVVVLLGFATAPGATIVCAQQHGPERPATEQPRAQDSDEQPNARGAQTQAHTTAGAGEEHHDEGILPTVAKLFNFAVLVGVLVYFLKSPIAAYLQSRSTQIRQDLVTAADMRAAATAQLAEIDRKLQALPAELDALRARGAEDVRTEKVRIAEAAAAERERLLDQTRREIDMRLRIARRDLVEHAAELAVQVARERISRSITTDDQLRMLDRYTRQLQEAR
jgi:F-type H+-transporting ATPase subunit b